MSDSQELQVEDKKVFLKSQNQWKPGEKSPVSYMPSVEGMVVSTTWIEHVLMVVFLSPPYAKSEGTWAEASLMYKTAASLVRKSLPSYDYPFPSDPRIAEEVKKANGNVEMLQELVKYLNKLHPAPSSSSEISTQKLLPRPLSPPDELDGPVEQDSSDRLALHLLLSQHEPVDQAESNGISDKVINKLTEAVSKRLSINNEFPTQQVSGKKKAKRQPRRKGQSSSSSVSFSGNTSSDTSSSSDDENVGLSYNEDGKGWFTCPFPITDTRTTAEPRQKMKGKIEERRYIRKALHDIYSEYNTLKAFVDTVRSESLSSSSKPYNSDIIWLSFHASYLDLLLLHASNGPWTTWNELAVDHLMKSFLELLVRSSSNRAYPEILDEKVRKWMKRKRVGLSGQFGAIPGYLSGAKITDSGIHPKGGWENRNFNKSSSSSFSENFVKSKAQNAAPDKKV